MYTLCPLPNTEHLRGPTKTQLTTHERNCTAKNRMEPALPPPSSYNTHTFHALMVCCTEGETSNCVVAALRAIDQHQHHVGKRYPGCQRAVRSDCSTKKRGSGCVGKKNSLEDYCLSLYLCHSRTTGPVYRQPTRAMCFVLSLTTPFSHRQTIQTSSWSNCSRHSSAVQKLTRRNRIFTTQLYPGGRKKWFFFFTQHSTHLKKPASLANAQTCNSNDTDTGHAHPANSAYVCVCVCTCLWRLSRRKRKRSLQHCGNRFTALVIVQLLFNLYVN